LILFVFWRARKRYKAEIIGRGAGWSRRARSIEHIPAKLNRRDSQVDIVLLEGVKAAGLGVWLLWWLDFNLSIAVAVGFIALAGVAAETGVVMLIYLDQALRELKEKYWPVFLWRPARCSSELRRPCEDRRRAVERPRATAILK
jgi:hypothetical protein